MSASKQLDALYARLPMIKCQGKCQASCGPIGMSFAEHARMIAVNGAPLPRANLTCPFLSDGRCSVYAVRPMICRLWGLVKVMRCPHGCLPDRWVGRDESYQFLDAAEEIGGAKCYTHPHVQQLIEAMRDL